MERKNIVLDLDNTLICAEAITDFPFDKPGIKEKVCKFTLHDMDGYYMVFERPGLQKFLDYLFKNYNVSVWTAASKDYALFIIQKIILCKPDRELKYVLFSHHCDLSEDFYGGLKDLRLMWEHFGLEHFKEHNTIIIDDYDKVYKIQPKNCIHIKAFNALDDLSEKDKELNDLMKKIL